MRKRIFAWMVASAVCISALGGCAQGSSPQSSVSGEATAAATEQEALPEAAEHAESFTYADTVAWDGQYDVVVVGYGGAGATAAITAADEGASVLVLEKAPEGHEGGNTRYSAQLVVYGSEDEDATYQYYKALAGEHEAPDAVLKVYSQQIAHMKDLMADVFELDKDSLVDWKEMAAVLCPEYPELPGGDTISILSGHAGMFDAYLWQQWSKQINNRADQIDVWFESPAVHLIQDPQSRTILGVQAERGGETLNIRALNGVVMACGGYENNPQMVEDYLGIASYNYIGTEYNTGDGIRMAMEAGADLWHMDCYESHGPGGAVAAVPDGERTTFSSASLATSGAAILVTESGERYVAENEDRHGHVNLGNGWVNPRHPDHAYIICTAEQYEEAVASGNLPENVLNVQQAGSIAELAELISIDPETLTATVERYNGYAASGYDAECGRSAESMAPITGDSFYAVEARAGILNTQGGARRNENAEVIGTDGNPIPHLYAAGEFGGVTAFQYNGGGNLAECIIFGQIAGKNAAAEKESLPVYEVPAPVDSSLHYMPGTESDLSSGIEVELGENEYLGISHAGMAGDLYVKVTMDGENIAKVEVLDNNETPNIGTRAIEAIPDAIVNAGSTEVDNISGATITSKAIKEAVEDALSQVK